MISGVLVDEVAQFPPRGSPAYAPCHLCGDPAPWTRNPGRSDARRLLTTARAGVRVTTEGGTRPIGTDPFEVWFLLSGTDRITGNGGAAPPINAPDCPAMPPGSRSVWRTPETGGKLSVIAAS